MTDQALRGYTVLVTRPSGQAAPLCRRIEQAGGTALPIPALAITPIDTTALRQRWQTLKRFDIAVFVSINAVEQALALSAESGLPKQLTLAAIGNSSADALRRAGYADVVQPQQRFDSEGLLQNNAFSQIAGKAIAIVRGEGGREWLAQQLRQRGARVELFELYRRERPESSRLPLQQALATGGDLIVSATSDNGLDNLLQLAAGGDVDRLRGLPLAVLSERNADHARNQGFYGPIAVAGQADDDAIVRAAVKLTQR